MKNRDVPWDIQHTTRNRQTRRKASSTDLLIVFHMHWVFLSSEEPLTWFILFRSTRSKNPLGGQQKLPVIVHYDERIKVTSENLMLLSPLTPLDNTLWLDSIILFSYFHCGNFYPKHFSKVEWSRKLVWNYFSFLFHGKKPETSKAVFQWWLLQSTDSSKWELCCIFCTDTILTSLPAWILKFNFKSLHEMGVYSWIFFLFAISGIVWFILYLLSPTIAIISSFRIVKCALICFYFASHTHCFS